MNLTEHFTLNEFLRSSTAVRLGIDNSPSPTIAAALTRTAMAMERVRALLGHPIHITSGYRSPALNKVVGGSSSSAHCHGHAVDFTCPGFGTPLTVAQAIRDSDIEFDRLIHEGTWVHLSFDARARREVSTAHFSSTGVRYTPGV